MHNIVKGYVALLVTLVAAGSAWGQQVYVVDDAIKVSPEGKVLSTATLADFATSNSVWDGKQISLSGAKGEYVAFQVEIAAGEAIGGADVMFVDLKSADGKVIAANNMKKFREWYIDVTLPSTSPFGSAGKGEYPDALIPADAPKNGLPVDVAAGKTQGIWVDVHIPRDAAAGKYKGEVIVTYGAKNLSTRLPLNLEVYDFAIPVQRHLAWKIGYSGFEEIAAAFKIAEGSDEYLKMEEDLYKMCWEECRFVPTTHYNTPHVPTHGTGANLTFDWTGFDKEFGKYLDGSAFEDHEPVNIFSLPVNCMQRIPTGGLDLNGLDQAGLEAATKDMVKHWAEKKWDIKKGFVYIADEVGPEAYPAIQKECDIIHGVDPDIRTSIAFYTHFGNTAPALVQDFSGHVTMWDIAGDYMNLPALDARRKAGDNVGFYQGSEPFEGSEAMDSDGLAMTTWPWIAWKYKLDHLFLYNMTEWSYFRLERGAGRNKPWAKLPREIWENPLNQSWQTNSQGVLIYPGQYVGYRGAVTSIRMKEIRRGMQDYEYFWMLSQKGQGAKADEIATGVIHKALYETGVTFGSSGAGAWERDPRKWSDARKGIAAMLK